MTYQRPFPDGTRPLFWYLFPVSPRGEAVEELGSVLEPTISRSTVDQARRAPLFEFELDRELFALRYDGPALPSDTLFELPPTFPRTIQGNVTFFKAYPFLLRGWTVIQ